MLKIIALILLVLWLGGFALHVAGSLIHILIVLAIIVFVVDLLKGGFGSKV
jgi:hypothetical protein